METTRRRVQRCFVLGVLALGAALSFGPASTALSARPPSALLSRRAPRPVPPPLFAAIAPAATTATTAALLQGITFSFSCAAGAYGTITMAGGGASQLIYLYNCSGLGATVTIPPDASLAAALRTHPAQVTLTLDVPAIRVHSTTPGIARATITVSDPTRRAATAASPSPAPALAPPFAVAANVSHAGWPSIDGDVVIAPDAVPVGDRLHHEYTWAILEGTGNNDELLGATKNDIIFGGRGDDVLWGDQTPGAGDPAQHDELYGGAGDDIIYTSHSYNYVSAGAGDDLVHAEFGYGTINCGAGRDTVVLTPATAHRYALGGCERRRLVRARS